MRRCATPGVHRRSAGTSELRTQVGRHQPTVALALGGLVFLALVYVPDAGRGFIKDDFVWIAAAARASRQPLSVFTADASGTFYRPLVSLSFVADYIGHGLAAQGYGATNCLLLLAAAAGIFALFVELAVTSFAAALGTVAWA